MTPQHTSALTHFDADGQAHMVDVAAKAETHRIARAAGTYVQVVGRDKGMVIVRLNSGEASDADWRSYEDWRSSGHAESHAADTAERLEAYREVRDQLARRIRERFGKASTFGG